MADELKAPAEDVNLTTLFPVEDADKPKADAEKTDVKPEKTPSSGDSTSDKDADEEPDATSLREKIDGLQKELSRVRRTKKDSAEEVQGLREQLANVQGQIETLSKAGTANASGNKLAQYSDAQLVQGQTEWEDELLDARDALREARKSDDKASANEAGRALGVAKQTLAAIRQELLERTKRVGADQAKAQGEAAKIVEEVTELYDHAYEVCPDLKDKESEMWQAGNDEYNARPHLMKQLGPLGELVAVALAITNNPELVGGKKQAKVARKELLSEINDKAESALLKGGGKAKSRTAQNFADLAGEDFERIVNKVKLG